MKEKDVQNFVKEKDAKTNNKEEDISKSTLVTNTVKNTQQSGNTAAGSAVLQKDLQTHDGKETDANSTTKKKEEATNTEGDNRPCNKSNASCENCVEHPCSSEDKKEETAASIKEDGGSWSRANTINEEHVKAAEKEKIQTDLQSSAGKEFPVSTVRPTKTGVHANPPSTRAVFIGKKHDVAKVLETADKGSSIQCDIELPPEKIKLFKSTRYLADLEKSLSVKIEIDAEKLRVFGPEPKISSVRSKLNLTVVHKTVPITDSIWKCLQNQEIFLKISSILQNHGVVINLGEVIKTINFLAMSQKDLSNGIERFKQTVVEEHVPLSESDESFIMGQKGSLVIKKLLSSKNFVLSERRQRSFKFTGLADECSAAKEQLIKILEENVILTEFLPFSLGKTKAVLMICKERIDKLLEEKRDHKVSVNKSEDECSIKVTGYGKSVGYVVQQIEVVAKSIKQETLVLHKPGLSKVIELDSSKQIIKSLEKEKEVIILRKEEDRKANVFSEETERESDIFPGRGPSELIGRHQISGKCSTKMLFVYKGDITKHTADAIVNPANRSYLLGGRVADAMLAAGGKNIQKECYKHVKKHGPLMDGDVVITDAGRLPCSKVIHAVVPPWPNDMTEKEEQELCVIRRMSKDVLTEMISNVLKAADANYCSCLAFPSISSAIFPQVLSVEILTKATVDILQNRHFYNLKEVHFVCIDAPTVDLFIEEFNISFGERFIVNRTRVLCGKHQQNPDGILESTDATAKSNEDDIKLELFVGDLGKAKADVIVNITNKNLDLSGNPCAQALSRNAGKSLQDECTAWVEANGQLPAYSFAETNGGVLKCKRVLHAVCAKYNGKEPEAELEKLITKLLDAANKTGSKSIAIGTGQLQFPKDNVAKIIVDCTRKLNQNTNLEKVILVAFEKNPEMIAAFENALIKAGDVSASLKKRASTEANNFERSPSVWDPLTPVVFNLYFSQEKSVVEEIQGRMMKALSDHIGSTHVQKEIFKTLPINLFEKIESFAAKHDVLATLDKNAGKIEMSGCHRDLASVKEYCHEMAAHKVQQREKEQMVANYVQWKEKREDGSLWDYDQALNYQIERLYNQRDDIVLMPVEDLNGIHTYTLNFSNKEEMKIISEDGKQELLVIREDVVSSKYKDE